MKVFLDGKEMALDEAVIEGGKEAVYEEARIAAQKDGRVITGFVVDGLDITSLEAFLKIGGGLEVRFTSQAVRVLVSESLEDGTRYMKNLLPGLADIATKFERGDNAAAGDLFSQAAEGVNWLVGIFERCCGLLGITSDMLKAGDFAADSAEMKEALTELTSIMEKGDDLKLAFAIRNRLIPVLEGFSKYWDEVSRSQEGGLQ